MKKFILSVIMLFSLILSFANVSCANISEDIDKETQKCLDTNFVTDYHMAQCNYVAIEKYDKEISNLIDKFKPILNKSQYKLLIDSQTKWKSYIDSDNLLLEKSLESKFYFEPHLISSNIKYNNYKQHYLELNELYNYLNMYK